MTRSAAVVLLLGALGALFTGGPASAEVSVDDERVPALMREVLEEVPGGRIIDAQRAVWPDLGMELFVPDGDRPRVFAAVGTCASARVCVFTGSSLTGARLSWSTCATVPIPSSFTARSVADARPSGYAQARSGTTVLATAVANGWANVVGSATNVQCVL